MEYANCNLCDSNDTRILYKWGKSNVVVCRKCGLIYKNPRYPEESIMFRYATDEFGGDGVDCTDTKQQIFNRQICKIENMVRKGKLLDVGCGYGDFLKIACQRGWEVQGVEVSDRCCRFAKETSGLNIFQGTLRQANFSEGYFDAVTMWDSLDFMYDPTGELLEARRILKPDGLIVVRVRNAEFHVFVKRIFRNSDAIVHMYSFSSKTIRLMLEKTGFREIRVMNSNVTDSAPFSSFLNLMISFLDFISNLQIILSPSLLVYARK